MAPLNETYDYEPFVSIVRHDYDLKEDRPGITK